MCDINIVPNPCTAIFGVCPLEASVATQRNAKKKANAIAFASLLTSHCFWLEVRTASIFPTVGERSNLKL